MLENNKDMNGEIELETGKIEGDQPYYIDYGYTRAEFAFRLQLDRMSNDEWRGSGYVFCTDEE